MKVVVNRCFGGFGLSAEAEEMIDKVPWYEHDTIEFRTSPKLVNAVEVLGDKANGFAARLRVVDVPDEATDWRINEYDGSESITYVLNGKMVDA